MKKLYLTILVMLYFGCSPPSVDNLEDVFNDSLTLSDLYKHFGEPLLQDSNEDYSVQVYYFRFNRKFNPMEQNGRLQYVSGVMVYAEGNKVIDWDFSVTVE